MTALIVALLAGAGACLAMPPRFHPGPHAGPPTPHTPATATAREPELGWMLRWRWALSALTGLGAFLFVGGTAGGALAVVAGVACWVGIGRVEPPAQRREREQTARELPHLVRLLGAALAAGAAPVQALEAVTEAAPGAASARIAGAAARLRLGADPHDVWSELARAPSLGPLGRTLARAHSSGAPVAVAVQRLAEELARAARADVEGRARAVGVKAAVPLGLCLLPSFLLLGVVPLVAGLLASLHW